MTYFMVKFFTHFFFLFLDCSTLFFINEFWWKTQNLSESTFCYSIEFLQRVITWCSSYYLVPWCSGYHFCTTSFIKAWTQILRRFKSCSRGVGALRWWGSLTMVPAGNKVKRLSSVKYATKTIHHHHQLAHFWKMISCIYTEIT